MIPTLFQHNEQVRQSALKEMDVAHSATTIACDTRLKTKDQRSGHRHRRPPRRQSSPLSLCWSLYINGTSGSVCSL
ncbi:hypothetical protein P8452_65282 [Trifolium repens]|nr:hypothetical protein P8452_65282 [Trifolium repens]